MKSVDEKVVQMQFDNKQFESGVKQSTESLNNLKKGLDLNESAKNLSNLEKVASSFSLANISAGVDSLNQKFQSLGIVGITILQNLTNAAFNAGKNIVSSLTIDPIKTGLSEYETKINAIQTILTNTQGKGTTLDDVNATLAELNTYADQTIYNFAEMTRNIGTFTAAGIDLQTSATAIKGIANLAAGSGSNAQQASTAMYQLSQALAAGKVSLMDWNSVVNAGMGGQLFQKALEKTAEELGHGRNMAVSFRDSLQDGWITTDVLTKTLQKFADDPSLIQAATQVKTFTQLFDTMKESVQSGWAVSWENIIGDKDQAAATLTKINNAFGAMIAPSTDARNAMLQFWNTNGGRDAVINGISNAFKGLVSVIKPIKEAFRDIFPAMTGERLVELSKGFRDLTENFKIGESTANNIKNTFKGLFSVLDIAVQVLSTLVQGVASLVGVVLPAGQGFWYLTSAVGSFVTKIDESIKSSGILSSVLEKFKELLKTIPNMFSGFGKISDIFVNLAGAIAKAFGSISGSVSTGLENFNFEKLFDIINGGLFAAILLGIKKFIGSLTDITEGGKGMLSGITEILDGVKGSLEAYQQQLKAGTLMKIAIAVGILAASIVALSTINPEQLASSLAAMSVMFGQLIVSMGIFEKFVAGPGFKSMITLTTTMLGLSTAILILSFAMKNLAEIDWNGIAKGLTAITVLSAVLVATSKVLSTSSGKVMKGATGFILFSAAILVLTQAVKSLAELDVGGLTKGLIGVGILCTELSLFMKATDLSGMGIHNSVGILILSGALLVLSKAVGVFASMDIGAMTKGLVAIGIILTQLALFVNLTGNAKNVITTAIGLTILGAALLIFSNALDNLGSMSVGEIAKGLITLSAALLIMGVAINAMNGALPGAAAILVMAGALAILAPVLKILGSMSLVSIGTSLLALVGVFVVLGGAALILSPLIPVILALSAAVALFGVGCLAVGAGVLALSAGFTALAVAGTAGTVALVAAVSGLIGLIPMFLKQVAQGLIEFAGVIGKGGPAIVSAFTTLLLSALQALETGIPKIIEVGMKLVLALLKAIADNIYPIIKIGTDIIVKFLEGVAYGLPKIVQAGFDLIITFINSLANSIEKNAPRLTDAFLNLGTAMIKGLVKGLMGGVGEAVSSVTSLGASLITAFKEKLGIHSPSKVFEEAGGYMVQGLNNGLTSGQPSVKTTASNLATTASTAVRETSAMVAVNDGKYIVDGIVIGMVSKKPDMYEASKLLTKAVQDGIIEESPRFTGVGQTSGSAMLEGLTDQQIIDKAWASGVKVSTSAYDGAQTTAEKMQAAGTAAGQAYIDGLNKAAEEAAALAEKIANNAASGSYSYAYNKQKNDVQSGAAMSDSQLSKLSDADAKKYWSAGGGAAGTAAVNAGKQTASGLASGIKSGSSAVSSAVKSVTTKAITTAKTSLGIHSPSRVFASIGEYSILGFVNGISSMASNVKMESENIAALAVNAIGKAISNLDDSSLNPTITPVLDLSNIKSGAKGLSSILGPTSVSVDKVSDVASRIQQGNNPSANSTQTTQTSQMTFVQNNYSPKPLSRLEIYRQTKNQFSTLKGLVNS